MTDIDVDASELDDAKNNLLKLAKNLDSDASRLQENEPEEMLTKIKRSIDFTFGSSDGEGASLRSLFGVKSGPYGALITTKNLDTGEGGRFNHAPRGLEDGLPAHPISGNDGPLAFQPDNPSKYKDSMVNEDGYVIVDSVYWKPDESASGYKYVHNGQQAWESEIEVVLPQKIRNSIVQSGFK